MQYISIKRPDGNPARRLRRTRLGRKRYPYLDPALCRNDRRRRRDLWRRPLLIEVQFQINPIIQHIVYRWVDAYYLLPASRQRSILVQVTTGGSVVPDADIQPESEVILRLLSIYTARWTIGRRFSVARNLPAKRQSNPAFAKSAANRKFSRTAFAQLEVNKT